MKPTRNLASVLRPWRRAERKPGLLLKLPRRRDQDGARKPGPGVAHQVFQALAAENVDVDMIVQSIRTVDDEATDIVFTIALDDVVLARDVLNKLKETLHMEQFVINEQMAKVSIIGAGMLGQPGVAAQMFGIFSEQDINIEIISTSEISITCLIAENRVKDAVKAIHEKLVIDERG